MSEIDEEALAKAGYAATWEQPPATIWEREHRSFRQGCLTFARAVVANLGEQGFTVAPAAPYRRVIVDLGMARRCVPDDEDQHNLQTAYEAVSSWIGAMKQEDIVALQRVLSTKHADKEEAGGPSEPSGAEETGA